MTTTQDWKDRVGQFRYNPAAIQRISLSVLEETSNGQYNVIDPNNPFVFLLEASAVNSAAAMQENAANTRKQYASMAMTEDELYLHMSDSDYAGRFASPSRASITFLFEKSELINRVVPVGDGMIKKMTIPRHTQIEVAGVPFTMQYPIDIRLMAHGGFQVVYDVDRPSPLETLASNMVAWEMVNLNGMEFLRLDVPMSQFKIATSYVSVSRASAVNQSFAFEDKFYYARVFNSKADGSWQEIRTTHTDQVFDPTKPTALLRVTDGKLNVSLPQIYLTVGLVTTDLRVDIYTTKGQMEMVLDNYQANAFKATWLDLEKDDGGKFINPVTAFTTMTIFSGSKVTGGADALTFEQLRERVMDNATGVPDLPITNVQLDTRLQDLGYDLVKDVDNVTNRQFMATRQLPRPADNSVVSGAGATVQTLTASMVELGELTTVKDNGNRITILPTTLYQSLNGLLRIVPQASVAALMALPIDVRSRRINDENYLYTPFHYVLDKNDDQFDLRTYYLDSPAVEAKSYVQENDTTGIAVATADYSIERIPAGYKLQLLTVSSDAWKAVPDARAFCQLSYRPAGEKDRAYLNGVLIGEIEDERVYEFILGTDFDIDSLNNIALNTFQMYANPADKHATALVSDFDVVYAAADLTISGLKPSTIDNEFSLMGLPDTTVGISRERLNIRLGDVLNNLWRAARSVVSSEDYERYTADVPALYEQTVFERDSSGNIVFTIEPDDSITYHVLHEVGDPVLDEWDNPVIKHQVGDIKLDPDGQPIVKNSRTLLRQLDLFLLDGAYWFATEASAKSYRDSLPATVVDWVNGDLGQVSQYLLEQTNLYFYPKSTLGQIPAIIGEDQRTTLPAAQSFKVEYYLRGVQYRDAALRSALQRMATETINEALQQPTVTMSEITSRLTARAGTDIIGVQVWGLGGSLDLSAVSLEDDSARLSIKKVAVPLADGTIGVQDDVGVTFIQHTPN